MKWVLVTGSNGGIGAAIANRSRRSGLMVLGVDKSPDVHELDAFLELDLVSLVHDETARQAFLRNVKATVGDGSLVAVINNAATQLLSDFAEIDVSSIQRSIDINLVSPMIVTRLTFKLLEQSSGCVVNVGSIHSEQTKPGFTAYATSKAGLAGFTRALAVDSQGRIRSNMIEPAAISTPMLAAGFESNSGGLDALRSYHPLGRIGEPDEIAELVAFIISGKCNFLNGSVIDVSGGIRSRLHDPD